MQNRADTRSRSPARAGSRGTGVKRGVGPASLSSRLRSSSDKDISMSKLNAGETEIIIGSEKLIFRPSLRVAKEFNRVFGALGSVIEKLRIADLDAVNAVIRIGAGIDDKRARLIDEWIWNEMGRSDTSFGELIGNLINFVALIQRGGRPVFIEGELIEAQDAGNE